MAWEFILQTLWFLVCVYFKRKGETKEKFVAVSIYNEASPSLPRETLFCPFIIMAKPRFVSLKQVWLAGKEVLGALNLD